MEPKRIAVLVFVCIVCVAKADVPQPTALEYNMTSTDCGIAKLCWSNVPNCDPLENSTCFFTSIQLNSQTVFFELSGWTSGYVALKLAAINQTEVGDVVFVCANNNTAIGTFFFETASQNGTNSVSTIDSVQGALKQNDSLIQCSFTTTSNLTSNSFGNLTLTNTTTVFLAIMTGSTNGTQLGEPTVVFNSTVTLDLYNSNSQMTTQIPMTTANSGNSLVSFCTQGLAVILSAMSLDFITSHSP
ncbi:putative ferric-chelate reductase 1 [Tachysurus fulvidraco]|uniref:putative ferric-chelate reductase 1 n=1 Tax=Tachysurus fulvidraco TaxID=1234273 RepID=UPI001FEE214A|nr:putative ferric-chelate reductase 1 [Tachysurus fulvidraco]XP_047676164.1 putative ferric-chelate reductase 1 [Tachysurus fulvidraco]